MTLIQEFFLNLGCILKNFSCYDGISQSPSWSYKDMFFMGNPTNLKNRISTLMNRKNIIKNYQLLF